VLLDSQEYLDSFGYDTVPSQRNRVLPGRDLGDTPFNITSPRYDEYYRGILGFPQIVFMGGPGKALPARAKIKRGGAPADYLEWLKGLPMPNPRGNSATTDIDYMSRVPFRSIGR
jgi:phycobilisome rod-core linker protein